MVRRFVFAIAIATLFQSIAHGDEITLKNGDHLTGTVTSASGGKLKFKTGAMGEVTVDMNQIQSLKTDAPVEIRLKDGTTLKEPIEPAGDNRVRTIGGQLGPLTIPLSGIDLINPPPPPPVKWTGSVLASGTISRGNTYSDSFNLSANALRRSADDRITLGAGYSYARERDESTGDKFTSEDNWFVLGQYDHFLTKKLYMLALTRVEKDRIANLDLRVSPGIGVGYQWAERPDFNFNTEAGVGWIYEEYEDHDGSESHFTARGAYHLDRQLAERVRVFHNLEYLPSVEDGSDFNVNADIGLRVGMTKQLFTEFKIEWQYDATPAPGADKNDTKYLLSLGWQF